MNIFGWVLLVALGVTAVADWVAVERRSGSAEQLAKPAFMVLLIAFAWLLHADGVARGWWLLAALALCLVGDVLLLNTADLRFGLGLLSFLLAHLTYLAALTRMPHTSPLWVGVVAVPLVLLLVGAPALAPVIRRDPTAGLPPTAYAIVLGVFTSYAWYTGHVVVGVGASLFCLSDALVGWTRFVGELRHGELAVMVTYHLAQLLIVVGVLRPDLGP